MDQEEEQKKAEEEQAGAKTAHVAGKAAATYFGGAAGNAIYNAVSKTKAGQAIENVAGKAINSAPFAKPLTKGLNKTGALDAADKGIDMAGGGSGGAAAGKASGLAKEKLAREGLEEKAKDAQDVAKNTAGKSDVTGDGKGGESKGDSASGDSQGGKSGGGNTFKIIAFLLSPFAGGCGCSLLIILILAGAILMPGQAVVNFFDGFFEGDGDGMDYPAAEKAEKEYYQTLEKAQEKAYQKYGVCVDVNLIHATLSVDRAYNEELETGEEECDDPETCDEDSVDTLDASDYKKMEKYIDVLVNMQIKRKKYGLVKAKAGCLTEYQSQYQDQCSDDENSYEILVDDEEHAKECMDVSRWGQLFTDVPIRDSRTPRLVARNDIETRWFNFLTKKANRERNYEYYYYIPGATFLDTDKDGVIDTRVCEPEVPKDYRDFAQLSIADWETMEDSVYFWNLMDNFIEEYYDDYLDAGSGFAEEGSKRYEDAYKILDRIYDYYTLLGPSRDCSEKYAFQTVGEFCTDGVTVTGKNAGTYDLEEYIAGVVEAEMYADFPMESKKALAVAARSYVIASTNSCEQAIDNSSNAQNFNPNYSQESWEAADSTRGQVITENGKVVLAQYDSWDCPGRLTCEYTKLPSGEKHTVTITNKYSSRAAGGHGRGMSQIAAADMAATKGSTYTEILSYFYTGGMSSSTGGSGEGVKGGSTSEKLAFLFPDGLPTSSQEMQKYLTKVTVPVVDINGNRKMIGLTVHQAIAGDVAKIYQQIADAGFPIKDTYCYSWRGMAGNRQTTSHHSYGVACDINANENYMIKNGSVISGSFWKPGVSPYSIVPNGPVVRAFSQYGWGWGGNWNSSKDYMHFSFTGH